MRTYQQLLDARTVWQQEIRQALFAELNALEVEAIRLTSPPYLNPDSIIPQTITHLYKEEAGWMALSDRQLTYDLDTDEADDDLILELLYHVINKVFTPCSIPQLVP